jgi:hypothetical protein
MDQNLEWPADIIVSTRIHTFKLGDVPAYTMFRYDWEKHPILDIIYISRHLPNHDISLLSISELEEAIPEKSRHAIDRKGHKLSALRTPGVRTVCFGACYNNGQLPSQITSVSFLDIPKEAGQQPKWVRLELPKEVLLRGPGFDAYMAVRPVVPVLAFDDICGRLLLADGCNYCMVQY